MDAPGSWDAVRIERRVAHSDGGEQGALPLLPAGRLSFDPGKLRCTFAMSEPPDDTALVHPYLAPAAALAASWLGWQTFHGGAFDDGQGAWVVLGESDSGKSTLLAALARHGVAIVADDLSCIRNGVVAAGPRCLDLRRTAADALGGAVPLGVIGARERWRVTLGPVDAETPLRGWLVLRWGDGFRTPELEPRDRIRILGEHVAVSRETPDYEALLALAAAPMVAFERPHDTHRLAEGARVLLAALRGVAFDPARAPQPIE